MTGMEADGDGVNGPETDTHGPLGGRARRVCRGPPSAVIQKWLKGGVLDTDGHVIHPATGTPQGGSGSPIVAHGYGHDALDRWFEKVVKTRCKGEAGLLRNEEDFVCACEDPADATAWYTELGERLGTFKLARAAEKTRISAWHRQPTQPSVEFLGVEWNSDRTIVSQGQT